MDKDREANGMGEINSGEERLSGREFFAGLGKWSLVVIGAALGGSALLTPERDANGAAWANRGGGGAWANRGGGGGGWANRAGGGGAWANRGGGGGWVNRF